MLQTGSISGDSSGAAAKLLDTKFLDHSILGHICVKLIERLRVIPLLLSRQIAGPVWFLIPPQRGGDLSISARKYTMPAGSTRGQ
jgi:hypothetical protein